MSELAADYRTLSKAHRPGSREKPYLGRPVSKAPGQCEEQWAGAVGDGLGVQFRLINVKLASATMGGIAVLSRR